MSQVSTLSVHFSCASLGHAGKNAARVRVDVYWLCQVPGSLDTLLGQIVPPPKKTFLPSRRIRKRSLSSIVIVDTLEGDKGANNNSCLPETQCKS